MPYEYLEETAIADIAFEARGQTLEELFQCAADAVTNVMIEDLNTIEPKESRFFKEKNNQLDLLLFDFLQEIIFYKDSEQIMLRAFELKIKKSNGEFCISTTFKGEPLNPEKHEQRVDVKAVTLHQFTVEKTPDSWRANVILDI